MIAVDGHAVTSLTEADDGKVAIIEKKGRTAIQNTSAGY